MSRSIFSDFATVRYEGVASTSDLAYRWYDAERVVLGKPLREHLRFAVAYWHSLAMNGSDPFGAPTIHRPWMGRSDAMQAAREKADAAFVCWIFRSIPFMTGILHRRARLCGSRLPICTAWRITWR